MVADNPVEGLRALAKRQNESCQIFLWRADHYVEEQFRGKTLEEVQTELEKGGAGKEANWNPNGDDGSQILRYLVQEDVIKSRITRGDKVLVEITQYKGQTKIDEVRRERDFEKGTMLDHFFKQAREGDI